MMTLKETGAAAAALGNQVAAGIPVDQALTRLVQMQPGYAEFWTRAALLVQSGRPLSEALVEVWPAALVSAVKAGERSGKLEGVLARIEENVDLQLSLRTTLFKLAYPVGMGLAGLAVFVGFMLFVLPGLAKSLATKSQSFVFELSTWMSAFVFENWTMLLAVGGAGVAALIMWLRTPEAQGLILELLLEIPVVKTALRDMYFGLWSNYMAMMVAAGITTSEALKLTGSVLPAELKESIAVFERDLSANNRSIYEAANLSKLPAADARVKWWPFYISNAFLVAEQTGEIDRELLRVAPSLIKEGVKTMNTVIAAANVVALAVSAFLIVAPLGAYYTEIFSAIQQAGR